LNFILYFVVDCVFCDDINQINMFDELLWVFYGILGRLNWPIFWAYAKQLVQINKLLCIIHKHVNVVYEKTTCEDTIFVSENL